MAVWCGELGFSPESFWDQTPRTLAAILDAKQRARKREHEERTWLAHTTAALGRVKKFPSLDKLLPTEPRRVRQQTPEEIEAGLRSFFAGRKRSG